MVFDGRPPDYTGCWHSQETQHHCLWDCPLQCIWRQDLRLFSYTYRAGLHLGSCSLGHSLWANSGIRLWLTVLLYRLSKVTSFLYNFQTSAPLRDLERVTLASSWSATLHSGLFGERDVVESLEGEQYIPQRLFQTFGLRFFTPCESACRARQNPRRVKDQNPSTSDLS